MRAARGWVSAIASIGTLLCLRGNAAADAPATPTITEPGTEGELVNSGDVHMEAKQLASGIRVRVKDNTTTRIYARAAVGSATSACSGPLTYVERSPRAFNVKAARRRRNKRFHGKRRVRCLKRVKEKTRRR